MISKKGTVVQLSGEKTIKVEVVEHRPHPKYKKMYRVTKKLLVHDEKGTAQVGDLVTIVPCRRLSAHKSWILQDIIHTKKA